MFIVAMATIRVILSSGGSQLDTTATTLWRGFELSVGSYFLFGYHSALFSEGADKWTFFAAIIVACIASFRFLYTTSGKEKLKEASKSQACVLLYGWSQDTSTDCHERLGWTILKREVRCIEILAKLFQYLLHLCSSFW